MSQFKIINEFVNEEVVAEQAKPSDTGAVMDLLKQTALWLKEQGSTQWNALLEGEDSHGTDQAVQRGDVFIFKHEEQVVGMVMLLQQPSDWDVDLWGDEGHEQAIYVHRLAISRAYAGKQLGRKIMEWVESGITFAGKTRIRLDCIAENSTLNRFYSSLGYEYMGLSESGFSKYEKPFIMVE